ncbi:hypothetical protein [Nannocystis bainbridge]|uniref:Lipoprotein n=1 Tax=Nannocystis bainbridge TaxID=2995303 RepID=A0ABT5E807_9BACT|nr:hypothetical protein [Nannocystis bainbridge]MDC0721994.1 hypothetical protein [Nannocystis bainbridge]
MKRYFQCAVFLWAACRPLGDASLEGKHVVVDAATGQPLCGGSLAFMDEFVERVSNEFSISAPVGEERILFYWLDSQDFTDRSECGARLVGCARGNETFSRTAPHNHELVHNLTFALGSPPVFFAEGLAVVYQGLDGRPYSNVGDSSADVREALTATNAELVEYDLYPLAGKFTAFLISRHGIEAFLRLYTSLDAGAGELELDVGFRQQFGTSLDDSIAEFEAGPSCAHEAYDAKLMECNAPTLAWDGRALQMTRTLSCEDLDAIGPFAGDSTLVLHTIDIGEGGLYELRVLGEEDDVPSGMTHIVSMYACDNPCLLRQLVAGAIDVPQIGWLDPGRYSLRLHGPANASTIIGFQLLRVDDPSSAMDPKMAGT